jgi:adenylate cyclase
MSNQERRLFYIGLLLVLAISLFLAQSALGVKVNQVVRDQITDTRIRNEVTVVGIDDASLQKIGAWPWDRSAFAKALEVLHAKGAKVVVFDVLFLEKRNGDQEVEATLESLKKDVVFASKFDAKKELIESVYSNSLYAKNGVAHVFPDEDGKVRTISLAQKDARDRCNNSLAYQAFLLYSKNTATTCDTSLRNFLYQEKLPKTLSFVDVINGTISDTDVRDKVIFIGSNSLDIEDHFVGQYGEKVPGVYVHASVFTTLLNNSFLIPLSSTLYSLLIIVFLMYAIGIALRLKNPTIQGILIFFGACSIVALSLFLLSLHYETSLSILLFPYILASIYTIMYRYSITEKKNNYIKELFGQYVHPKVLANILKDNNLKLGGEKKYITILFSDIRGFTTLTEKMPPEELVETLNTYLEAMSPLIMNKEGVIDKYIGDAIMAFWNAPVDVHHHEEKAVRASLAMIEKLSTMTSSSPFAIGIGLHAGEAIVGNIGSKTRINYTIIGDAVNACSRLEGLTKKYGLEIIASEQIKNAVTVDDIVWRSIDIVRVKGKTEVMKLYEPLIKNEQSEKKVALSEQAFSHYLQGEFKEAHTLYKKINDTYSAKMLERIEVFMVTPPLSFDGTWTWDEK